MPRHSVDARDTRLARKDYDSDGAGMRSGSFALASGAKDRSPKGEQLAAVERQCIAMRGCG